MIGAKEESKALRARRAAGWLWEMLMARLLVGAACLGVLFLAVDSQPVLASLIRLEACATQCNRISSVRHTSPATLQSTNYFLNQE